MRQAQPGERFTYVYIPADMSRAIEERSESAEGGLEDDKLNLVLRSGSEIGPNLDIIAVTVPTINSFYKAVSLYKSGNDGCEKLEVNRRVVGLLTACGLQLKDEIRGDCVLSRMVDNDDDLWKRISITAAECTSVSTLCVFLFLW